MADENRVLASPSPGTIAIPVSLTSLPISHAQAHKQHAIVHYRARRCTSGTVQHAQHEATHQPCTVQHHLDRQSLSAGDVSHTLGDTPLWLDMPPDLALEPSSGDEDLASLPITPLDVIPIMDVPSP